MKKHISILLVLMLIFQMFSGVVSYRAELLKVEVSSASDFGTTGTVKLRYYTSPNGSKLSKTVYRYVLSSKEYILNENINLQGYKLYIPSGVTATLDLNGYTLDEGCSAGEYIGYMFMIDGSLTIKDSSNDNSGTITGCNNIACNNFNTAAVAEMSGNLTIEGGTFCNNRSIGYCGAMFNSGSTSTVKINGGVFKDNTLENSQGGIVASYGSTVEITGGEFYNISAPCGILVFSILDSNLTIDNVSCHDIVSNPRGSFIYAIQGNFKIDLSNSKFYDSVGSSLQCFDNDNSSSVTITDCEMYNNSSMYGDLVMSCNSGVIDSCYIHDNNSSRYGVINNSVSSSLTIKDSVIKNNSAATGYGGGVYTSSNLVLQDTTITGNNSKQGNEDIFDLGKVSLSGTNSISNYHKYTDTPIDILSDLGDSSIGITIYDYRLDANDNLVNDELETTITNGYKTNNPNSLLSDHFSLKSNQGYCLAWNSDESEIINKLHQHNFGVSKVNNILYGYCDSGIKCEYSYEDICNSNYSLRSSTVDKDYNGEPYNGLIINNSLSDLIEDEEVIVEYISPSTEVTRSVPVNAGSYNVKISFKDEYIEDSFKINKINPTLVTKPSIIKDSIILGNTVENIILNGVCLGGILEYSLDNISWQESLFNSSNLSRGMNTIYYRIKGDLNHYDMYNDFWKMCVNVLTPTPSPTSSPIPSPSPTNSPTPTDSPTPSPTISPTPSPTISPTPSPTISPTPSPTNSPTPSPTNSPTPSTTNSPTPSTTNSPTPSTTNSPTPSPTISPTPSTTSSPIPSPSPRPTNSPTPIDSPTPTPSKIPIQSLTPSLIPTVTLRPSQTNIPSPTLSLSPTPVPIQSLTPSPVLTVTLRPTNTIAPSPAISYSPTITLAPTSKPVVTKMFTVTVSPTPTESLVDIVVPTVSEVSNSSVTPGVSQKPKDNVSVTPSISQKLEDISDTETRGNIVTINPSLLVDDKTCGMEYTSDSCYSSSSNIGESSSSSALDEITNKMGTDTYKTSNKDGNSESFVSKQYKSTHHDDSIKYIINWFLILMLILALVLRKVIRKKKDF